MKDTKICIKCKKEYSIKNFYKQSKSNRYFNSCKKCFQLRKEKFRKEYPLEARCKRFLTAMKEVTKKGMAFDKDFFTLDHLKERLSKNPYCECCHRFLNLFRHDGKRYDDSPSIDRVNPSKGYIKGNVAILCWRCNRIKDNATSEDLRMLADFIDSWNSR